MKYQFISILLLFPFFVFSQVGIGTTNPNTSSALEISSTDSGLLIPRMTEAQKNGISSPASGLLIYQNNNAKGFYYYENSTWNFLGDNSNDPTFIIKGLKIPSCSSSGATSGSQTVIINGVSTTVDWEKTASFTGSEFAAQSVTVKYTFSPTLPYHPVNLFYTVKPKKPTSGDPPIPDSYVATTEGFPNVLEIYVKITRVDYLDHLNNPPYPNPWAETGHKLNILIVKDH